METLKRTSCRAILLTPAHEILLIKVENPDGGWHGWITPGGGIEPGETPEQALRRELSEELSLDHYVLGPQVWQRSHKFPWDGKMYDQDEQYYFVKTDKFEPIPRLIPVGPDIHAFKGFRWWKLDDLKRSPEEFAPRAMGTLLDELIQQGAPVIPKRVDV